MLPFELVIVASGIVLAIIFLYFTVLRQLEPDSHNLDKQSSILLYKRLTSTQENNPPPKNASEKATVEPTVIPPTLSTKSHDRKQKCIHFIGYLAERQRGDPIPDECFGCQQVVKCMKLRPTTAIESYYIDQTAS